jgi:hypothetical protein
VTVRRQPIRWPGPSAPGLATVPFIDAPNPPRSRNAALLAGVFAGIVLLATVLLPFKSSVAAGHLG